MFWLIFYIFPQCFFFIYLFYFVFEFVVVEYVGNVDWNGERAAEVYPFKDEMDWDV